MKGWKQDHTFGRDSSDEWRRLATSKIYWLFGDLSSFLLVSLSIAPNSSKQEQDNLEVTGYNDD
jgi:hypothetical protein